MPLHLRRRGEIWHIRGTIRVGRQIITIAEFSTGARSRADAQAAAAAEEARIRADALDGPDGRARRLTITECIATYLQRPGGIPHNDKAKVADLAERIGTYAVPEAPAAWAEILRTRGKNWSPGTAARWRATLQAALNAGAGKAAPRLPSVQEPTHEVATYLTVAEQDRLLAAYNPSAAPVAMVLCFAGLRTQEALRLDWRHVRWSRRELFVPGAVTEGGRARRRSKSGHGRAVPMHPRLQHCLEDLWEQHGKPDTGPVFLSSRGKPYADTRDVGGNPLTKAHMTACIKAGLCRPTGKKNAKGKPVMRHTFRIHDWRHHWGSWMVMMGADLFTLMRLGGWTTPRMVQRYAAVSGEHMAGAIARLR
jgi:integrase